MKNLSLFGLGAVSSVLFVACSLGETDEGTKESVKNFEDLPKCSPVRDAAGGGYMGSKFYVEEEELYYLCTERGWIVSDDTPVEKGEDNVVVVPEYLVENMKVEGVAENPGYFKFGSKVVLRELKVDSTKKTLVSTGNEYEDEISSDVGEFVIPKVSSYNEYALVEVSGRFYDIFSGEYSKDTLSMKSLFNFVNDSTLSVNLLNNAAYERALVLIEKGYDVSAAVSQAKKEFWTAVGFKTISAEDQDAALVALNVLLHGLGDNKDFIEAIEAFIKDFAEDGAWDDESSIVSMADFAFNLENMKLKDDDGLVYLKEGDIRKNLERFGIAAAPAFEAYVTKFWNIAYGLGACGAASENVVLKNAAESSDSTEAYFTCATNVWRVATDFERDTVSLGDPADGELAQGNVDASKTYAYDTTGWDAGTPARWKEADSIVVEIGSSCTDEEDVAGTIVFTKNNDDEKDYYACINRKWSNSDENTYKIGYVCNEKSKNVVEKVSGDKKDDPAKYFRCKEVVEGVWSWAPASEIDYKTREEECKLDEIIVVDKKSYVCTDSSNVSFREANEQEKDLDVPCSAATFGKTIESDGKNYSCACAYGVDYLMPLDALKDEETAANVETCKLMNTFTWHKD